MGKSSTAYQAVQNSVIQSRQVEADIFRRLNFALGLAWKEGNGVALVKAAADTRRFWEFLLGAVRDPQNPLPDGLKKQVLEIAAVVIGEVDRNINGNLDVDFLLAINHTFADGLSSPVRPAAAQQPRTTIA
jgi:flagellar biosynthesis activator protein FlaF